MRAMTETETRRMTVRMTDSAGEKPVKPSLLPRVTNAPKDRPKRMVDLTKLLVGCMREEEMLLCNYQDIIHGGMKQ